MGKKIIIIDKIESVELLDKDIRVSLTYKDLRKNTFFPDQPAGFYSRDDTHHSNEKLLSGYYTTRKCIIIDKQVFLCPCVEIRMVSGKIERVQFDTYKEAEKYNKQLLKRIQTTKLEMD
jgi:hypothetical protein